MLKNKVKETPVFVFLSKNCSGKYFCRSFFPDCKKDYAERQTKWTLLLKRKIIKSENKDIVLYRHKGISIK
ncbi:MAG: hypothetical protein IKQ66_04635 [Treponema sp.]|nr:hypothetical protein [Treponema sp.]